MTLTLATPHPATLPTRHARLSDLAPIELPDLIAAGSLLTRRDRKYVVTADALPRLLGQLQGRAQVLQIDGHRWFGYRTVYFDTPLDDSYLAATRRRPHRYKVRTRTYLDSAACWVEVKTKDGRGRTVKVRTPHPLHEEGTLAGARGFLAPALAGSTRDPDATLAQLTAVLTTHYRRATLFLPEDGVRVTIDESLVARDRSGARLDLTGHVIVETKSGSRPSAMDRALWRSGHRPIKVSKYATCRAALQPQLPASKWRPALRLLTPTHHRATPQIPTCPIPIGPIPIGPIPIDHVPIGGRP